MSWSHSFDKVTAEELEAKAAEFAASLPAENFGQRQAEQVGLAVEQAKSMMAKLGGEHFYVSMHGHAHAAEPGPRDGFGLSVSRAD